MITPDSGLGTFLFLIISFSLLAIYDSIFIPKSKIVKTKDHYLYKLGDVRDRYCKKTYK